MSNAKDPDANSLADLIATLQAEAGLEKPRSLPPVHKWNPECCGDIGLEIRRDGSWWQNGVRFSRDKLVRLFSTILRRDSDGYYLVTPHEKVVIRVEDVPFVGVRADRFDGGEGPIVVVTTNVGDVVTLGPDNALRVRTDPRTGEPSCYVHVRNGMEAKLARPPWYDIVAWAQADAGGRTMSLSSSGERFAIGELA